MREHVYQFWGGKYASDEDYEGEFPMKVPAQKYTYKANPVQTPKGPNGENYWSQLDVEVFNETGELVTKYHRNYSSMYKTFFSFTYKGKDYALYSHHYTSTAIMELPSGKEIKSEKPCAFGFCPVEFFVPEGSDFGFVSGCVWGDDMSWKLKCIDLRKLEEGEIKIFEPFGYCPLVSGKSIPESIEYFEYDVDENYINATILTEYEFNYDMNENNKE